jgi:hypothetical protein
MLNAAAVRLPTIFVCGLALSGLFGNIVEATPVTPRNYHYDQYMRECFCQRTWRIHVYQKRWARLLKQQSSTTVNHLLTKENKLPFPFGANKRKFADNDSTLTE